MVNFSLADVVGDVPTIRVVDVGASPIDGPPSYQALLDTGRAEVIGFEPDPDQFKTLQDRNEANATYFPYAIGDGEDAILHICRAPGMTSLLEPDIEFLKHFHGFDNWGEVVRRQEISTRRLDDEINSMDYLKLDVQGSELAVLEAATQLLEETLFVHTEVQFVPFYKNQPLFAELDQALRQSGFYIHRFPTKLVSRVFKPFIIDNDIYSGLSQILWADVVYVKKFTDFGLLSSNSLLKIAMLAHDLYGSFDLAALALGHVDEKDGSDWRAAYLRRLTTVS